MKGRRKERRESRKKNWDDYHAPFIQIRPLKKVVTDQRTDGGRDKASYRDLKRRRTNFYTDASHTLMPGSSTFSYTQNCMMFLLHLA